MTHFMFFIIRKYYLKDSLRGCKPTYKVKLRSDVLQVINYKTRGLTYHLFVRSIVEKRKLSGRSHQQNHRKMPLRRSSMIMTSVTRKKLPNVYKSWPKMISLEK